jgi:hypothetical protein
MAYKIMLAEGDGLCHAGVFTFSFTIQYFGTIFFGYSYKFYLQIFVFADFAFFYKNSIVSFLTVILINGSHRFHQT